MRVSEIIERQIALLQCYFPAVVIAAPERAVGSGVGREEIVETAVLLDDDDDVFERRERLLPRRARR